MSKYDHIHIVAKVPCQTCNGSGQLPTGPKGIGAGGSTRLTGATIPCGGCDGTGEREQEVLNPGEPFFLVRGQDLWAVTIMRLYAALLRHDPDRPTAQLRVGMDRLIQRTQRWQAQNPGLVKAPD